MQHANEYNPVYKYNHSLTPTLLKYTYLIYIYLAQISGRRCHLKGDIKG